MQGISACHHECSKFTQLGDDFRVLLNYIIIFDS
jgi:hypothetical protein